MIWYKNRLDVLSHAASIVPVAGLVLEFGVASGETIAHLAKAPNLCRRQLYGFDSFLGLPEPWSGYRAGHFACERPELPDNVELIVGMFADTIAPFLVAHDGPAALIHIDCDLYSSTRTVLELMAPRITAGTVIELDEYWIITDHEQRAFTEWLSQASRRCRPEARSIEQLCVVME